MKHRTYICISPRHGGRVYFSVTGMAQLLLLKIGMRLRSKTAITGISLEEHPTAVVAPVGTIVRVATWPPSDDEMVCVIWDSVNLKIFVEDILKRGEEVKVLSA